MPKIETLVVSTRHAELVSASIARPSQAVLAAEWTLNQVQGDGVVYSPEGCAQ